MSSYTARFILSHALEELSHNYCEGKNSRGREEHESVIIVRQMSTFSASIHGGCSRSGATPLTFQLSTSQAPLVCLSLQPVDECDKIIFSVVS